MLKHKLDRNAGNGGFIFLRFLGMYSADIFYHPKKHNQTLTDADLVNVNVSVHLYSWPEF